MISLGFHSAILPDCSLEEVFAIAAREGFDCVEVMCWPVGKAVRRYAGVTHIDVAELDDAKVAEIRALIERHGVAISALGYYPNALSGDSDEAAAAVRQIERVITAASRLGVGRMNTFVGRDPKKSVDENWPAFEQTWKPLIEHAEACGVRVGIENCPMLFGPDEWPGGKNLATSPAIWRRMFESIPSDHFGLNFDPSHFVFQQMDYLKPLAEFADRLFHIHAKDVRMETDRLNEVGIFGAPNDYHTPKLPGLGEIDWGRFLSVLGDVGYRGPVCVEVEDRVFEENQTTREMSLRQSHTYLRNFIPKMKA